MSMFSMSSSKLVPRLRERLLERVEVDDDEVDEACAEALEVGVVDAGPREDAAVDARVQRLHAALHHLGRAGVALDGLDRDPGGLERAVGAAGREQGDVARGRAPAQRRRDRSCRKRRGGRGGWASRRAPSPRPARRQSAGEAALPVLGRIGITIGAKKP